MVTFLRPLWEYGAGLVYGWIAEDPDTRLPVLSQLEELQNAALRWVVAAGKHPISMINTLTGIPEVGYRISELAIRMVYRLESAHPQNPVHLFKGGGICAAIRRSKLFQHVHRLRMTPAVQAAFAAGRNSLRHWLPHTLYSLRKGALRAQNQLSSYMNCTKAPSTTDRCMFIKHRTTRVAAIAWRRNAIMPFLCPRCGGGFNRRHVHGCRLLANSPIISQDMIREWEADVITRDTTRS
jgi:hypothetical protein